MNDKTLVKLEFNKIVESISKKTYFEGGRRKIEKLFPSADKEVVEKRLDETEEAIEALHFSDPGFLAAVKYIDNSLNKARVNGLLSPAELREIYYLLHASREAIKYIGTDKFPRMESLVLSLSENFALEKKINASINDEGEIRDDATPALKQLRNQINTVRARIRDYLQGFIRSENNQKLLQDAIVTERDGRYVVPVKQEYRHEVRGIIHDESASGATVFVEPLPVIEFNNQIRALQREEKREIERLLRELSGEVTAFSEELNINLDILSQLDAIFARARYALQIDAYRPSINDQGIIEINRGRHPLLGADAIPFNIELGRSFDILVITGPNTGGKTVTLKTIGLLAVMAMSGLFIPARENSRIPIFKSIWVDIGDEQSIEQSLSTFSSHMSNIIQILNQADEHSLVLLDELGAGTDPVEGAALARVILEELRSRKTKVVVSTHQSELKNYAYQNERVENASVEFDPVTLRPTYELTIGMPGQSNAFEIALRLGLDQEMVERARDMVPAHEAEISTMIRQLKESRYNFELSGQQINSLKAELEKDKQLLEQEKQDFYREKTEILEEARREAQSYIRTIKAEANEAVQELKDMIKEKEQPPKWHELEKSRQKIKKLGVKKLSGDDEKSKANDEPIRTGDYVHIKNFNQNGYVIEGPSKQGEIVVQAGILKLSVKVQDVNKTESPEDKSFRVRNKTYLEKAKHISKELDLRGKLALDALIEVDKYLEDANLVGLDSVMIIHGKGTGALRKAVREYLRDHRYVKNFRDGLREEGGFGVTIVELR